MNHNANELARGPSEGVEEKEGARAQFLCSGNYGNRSSTNWRAFHTVTAAGVWTFFKVARQAYKCCISLEFKWDMCYRKRGVYFILKGIRVTFYSLPQALFTAST